MYMKKDSHLTPFIAYQIMRLQEMGANGFLYSRNTITEPICQPNTMPHRSLGVEKAAFMFLSLLLAYACALVIFGFENLWMRELRRQDQRKKSRRNTTKKNRKAWKY